MDWTIYYSSPELFDVLNNPGTDATVTVRSNRKGLLRDIMEKKLKEGEATVSFRRKLLTLKWKDKKDVFMLSTANDEEMRRVHDVKGGEKQKLKVCINYNDTMSSADLPDQYTVATYSMTKQKIK